jgi:hypothetical protein
VKKTIHTEKGGYHFYEVTTKRGVTKTVKSKRELTAVFTCYREDKGWTCVSRTAKVDYLDAFDKNIKSAVSSCTDHECHVVKK